MYIRDTCSKWIGWDRREAMRAIDFWEGMLSRAETPAMNDAIDALLRHHRASLDYLLSIKEFDDA